MRYLKNICKSLLTRLILLPVTGPLLEKIALYLARRWPNFKPAKWLISHLIDNLQKAKWGSTERVACLQNGSKLLVNVQEYYARHVYFYGTYENEITYLFQRLVAPASIVFDVGANLGYYTCIAAQLSEPNGKVFAFEADGETFEYLTRTIKLNEYSHQVYSFNKAVYEESDKTLVFYTSDTASDKGLGSLLQKHSWGQFERTIEVTTVSLDDIIDQYQVQQIDLIKIDIEGAEIFALQGLVKTLKNKPPKALIIEVSSDATATPSETIAFLANFDYTAYHITNKQFEAVTAAFTVDYGNLLFIHKNYEQEIKLLLAEVIKEAGTR